MLTKISVQNFRNFKEKKDFNFIDGTEVRKVIVVSDSSISIGKTNLGYALIEPVFHLHNVIPFIKPSLYRNLHSTSDLAEFSFECKFDGVSVTYSFGKESQESTVYERMTIDGDEVISIDRRVSGVALCSLEGAETLKLDLTRNKDISVLRYVYFNTVLRDCKTTKAFYSFWGFIKGISFKGRSDIDHDRIITAECKIHNLAMVLSKADGLDDFHKFMSAFDINYDFSVEDNSFGSGKKLCVTVNKTRVDFSSIASRKAMSVANLYNTVRTLKSGSGFCFIDDLEQMVGTKQLQTCLDIITKATNKQVVLSGVR